MKKLIFSVLLLCGFIGSTLAGTYLETIQLPGNECLSSVAVLRTGEAIAAGLDFTSTDILLTKVNTSGSVVKAQRISGSAADEAQAVIATSDGGVVVVGSTTSFGAGNSDGFLVKMRANGSIAWKRTFGTSGNEHIVRIVQTRDKGFIILSDADHDPNLNDIVVAKFNPSGRLVWRKVVSGGAFDHASDLRLTSDNGAIVTIAADFTDGTRSILAKFNASGVVEWSRIYGSSGNHVGLSAFQTAQGDYYLTEIFTPSGSQRSDTVLAKLDSWGVPVWARILRSPGANLNASVTPIEGGLLLSGNITAAGGSNSRGILIGLNQDGNTLWRKKIKPDSRPVFISKPDVSSSDGSIVIAGCAGDRTANNMDSIILKIQPNGQIQGGCPKLTNFGLSNTAFNLTTSEITLEEIPVPFLSGNANFQVITIAAEESFVCSGE